MKNFYYAGVETKNGKHFAFIFNAKAGNNLLSIFKQYKNMTIVNACESKKKAEELADFWNESYKANGTYLFD